MVLDDQSSITAFETPLAMTIQATGGITPYTYTVTQDPAHGGLTGSFPNLTYTPEMDFVGEDAFTVQVTDAYSHTDTGAITVTVNPPPLLVLPDQTLDTPFERPLTIMAQATGGVLPLTYTVSDPMHGTVTGTIPNLTYTPDSGFDGSDTFSIQVTDRRGTTVQATISITVHAAYTVAADDVNGLIAAISAANANTWPDTIILTPGTYTLTAINNSDSNGKNGLPVIATEIAIRGNGATIARSGTNYFRFFTVSQTGILSLDNLTLNNGHVVDVPYGGGAIFNLGSLTISNSTLSNNTARTARGGAIFSNPAAITRPLTITNTTFTHNVAGGDGGAIYVTGSAAMEIAGSVFSDNGGLHGGAVLTRVVSSITNTSFIRNQASEGADLYAENSKANRQITIADSSFDGDHVATGSAIWVLYGQVYITRSIFVNHSPGGYAASVLYTEPYYSQNYAVITDSCIVNNGGTALREGRNLQYISAEHTWWGAADGPTLDNGSPAGSGQLIDADVYYASHLTNPPMPGCPIMPPVIDTQTVNVPSGVAVPVPLAARGGLPPYTYGDVSIPAHGTLTGTAPNLVYTPEADYTGPDSFTFMATDSVGGTANGTVEIKVKLPVQAVDQVLSAEQNVLVASRCLQAAASHPIATWRPARLRTACSSKLRPT